MDSYTQLKNILDHMTVNGWTINWAEDDEEKVRQPKSLEAADIAIGNGKGSIELTNKNERWRTVLSVQNDPSEVVYDYTVSAKNGNATICHSTVSYFICTNSVAS